MRRLALRGTFEGEPSEQRVRLDSLGLRAESPLAMTAAHADIRDTAVMDVPSWVNPFSFQDIRASGGTGLS